MKRIVLLTNILTPYRSYFYNLLYGEFINRGIDFKVIVTAESEPNRNWMYDDLKTNFTILSKGKVIKLPNNIFIHLNRNFSSLLRDLRPDLIISAGTYLYPALWSVLFNRKKMGYKVIYWNESHNHEYRNYSFIKLKLRENIRRLIFKKFDGFFYSGEWSLELIKQYCNKKSKFIFVPNLIDEAKYCEVDKFSLRHKQNIRKKYQIKEDTIVLVCPARLTAVKGQLNFLQAFKECDNKSNFTILLCGDGDASNEIANLIESNNNWNIKLLGYKNQDEIIDLYSISDFFLLPSLSDPSPLTCIEALWCGLPLIVSDHVGNAPEALHHNINGFIFSFDKIGDIKQLMLHVESCYKNKEWLMNASETSLSIAREIYASRKNTRRIVNELLSYYQE